MPRPLPAIALALVLAPPAAAGDRPACPAAPTEALPAERPPPGFVVAPAGSYVMGLPPHADGERDEAGPQRCVQMRWPLWVQAREVTHRQWRATMGGRRTALDACDDCPVDRVSWYDAAAYANARSRAEGLVECYALEGCGPAAPGRGCPPNRSLCADPAWRCEAVASAGPRCAGYRLPSEAEWEYFARAGTATRYSSGDPESALAEVGWYVGNSGYEVHPVGQKPPNAWGVFDAHGNVAEWCDDWYAARSPSEPAIVPPGPPISRWRVVRGGGFADKPYAACSTTRAAWGPDLRAPGVGFRLVRTAGRPPPGR